MRPFLLADLFQDPPFEKEIQIQGWVRSLRKSKKFAFLVLSDGTSFEPLQAVFNADSPDWEKLKDCHVGTALRVGGTIVRSQGGQQEIELHAQKFEILGKSSDAYPLQKKATSLEFLREQAHLRARTQTFQAVFQVRHQLSLATHRYFSERHFTYLHAPIITASDCEGAGELFRVSTLAPGETDFSKDYFGKETYLSVSGQLQAEAHALALGRVYTFGPTFRSENSNTARHLSEFWMIEPEVAFYDLDLNIELAQSYLKFILADLLEHCMKELSFLQERYEDNLIQKIQSIVESDFVILSYTEAIELLKNSAAQKEGAFVFTPDWGKDLQTEHERYLTETHFKKPVIVRDYPKEIKAFYMRTNDDQKTVAAMDVLVPGIGEIIGGSQREERLDQLEKRMQDSQLSTEDYNWYLDLRRFGGVIHSGFGLGLERLVMYTTGMSNIRDVIAFPRTPGNVDF